MPGTRRQLLDANGRPLGGHHRSPSIYIPRDVERRMQRETIQRDLDDLAAELQEASACPKCQRPIEVVQITLGLDWSVSVVGDCHGVRMVARAIHPRDWFTGRKGCGARLTAGIRGRFLAVVKAFDRWGDGPRSEDLSEPARVL